MKIRLVAIVSFVALAATGCAELIEPAAAVVGGNKIPMSTVTEAADEFAATPEFEAIAAQQGGADRVKRQFQQGFLATLIRRAVFEPIAEDLGIAISQADIDQRLEQIKADFESEEAFDQALRQQGLTLDQLRRLIADRLLEQELRAEITARSAPDEEELRAYYEANREQFEQTRAQHILVEDRAEAEDLVAQLRDAPSGRIEDVFARLARQNSVDETSARRGGDIGYFSRGDLVPEFEEAAAALEVGEISDPVRSQFGFHIIRVSDRRVQSFEEARDEIARELGEDAQQEAWLEWLNETYEAADVRVNPRFGRFDVETQQVVDLDAGDVPATEEQAPPTLGETPSPES